MSDHATPNLPSRNLDATAEFYEKLGFSIAFKDQGWMILKRGSVEVEFFPCPEIDPWTTVAGCCLRVADLDALYEAFSRAGLPGTGIPRITAPVLQPFGLREFAIVDLDGNLLHCLGA
jgi:catechol 2,3-dioxygenase-like lactoylglutathione lyase family enzyme